MNIHQLTGDSEGNGETEYKDEAQILRVFYGWMRRSQHVEEGDSVKQS